MLYNRYETIPITTKLYNPVIPKRRSIFIYFFVAGVFAPVFYSFIINLILVSSSLPLHRFLQHELFGCDMLCGNSEVTFVIFYETS